MLTLGDIFIAVLFALAVIAVWRGIAVREMAHSAVKRHLKGLDLQLLDENVALRGFWFKRNDGRELCAWYSYSFEFSSTGDERYRGMIVVLGGRVTHIELEPYRLADQDDVYH